LGLHAISRASGQSTACQSYYNMWSILVHEALLVMSQVPPTNKNHLESFHMKASPCSTTRQLKSPFECQHLSAHLFYCPARPCTGLPQPHTKWAGDWPAACPIPGQRWCKLLVARCHHLLWCKCYAVCSVAVSVHCPFLPFSCPGVHPSRSCFALTLNDKLQPACSLPIPHATPQILYRYCL